MYTRGDRVLYKREGKQQWLGPARVIFQDRKVVLLDHGGYYIKVSLNRRVKCSASFARPEETHRDTSQKKVMFEDLNVDVANNEMPEHNDHAINVIENQASTDGTVAESVPERLPVVTGNDLPAATGGRSDDDFVDTNRRSQRVINKELGCEVYMVTIPYQQQKTK